MSHFIDSENIILENGDPRFSYLGVSYRDKLKNGLPLEYVFKLQDHCSTFEANVSVTRRVRFDDCLNIIIGFDSAEYESDDEYDDPDITFPKKRKGKWNPPKKKGGSNLKKNKIKQEGYIDKLYNREEVFNVDFDFEEREIEYDIYNDDYDYDYYDSYSGPQRYYHMVRES
jgi:hypothetical protein